MEKTNGITFERNSFGQRMKTMLKVDFRRMFTMRLIYIMIGICFVMPVLILVMTTMMDGSVSVNPQTGAETVMAGFTSVWSTKSGRLLALSRLRTVRERFHSYGSSISSLFRATTFKIDLVAMLMNICHIWHIVLAAHGFRDFEENLSIIADFHRHSTVIATPILVFPDKLKLSR